MERRARVFLDSNVIFSGLRSKGGPPGQILEMQARREIIVVVSRLVLEEVVRTIKEKLPEALPSLSHFLASALPEVVADPSLEEVRHWEEIINSLDAPVLAAAIQARPDHVITGNIRHFTIEVAERSGLSILTPSQFVALCRPTAVE